MTYRRHRVAPQLLGLYLLTCQIACKSSDESKGGGVSESPDAGTTYNPPSGTAAGSGGSRGSAGKSGAPASDEDAGAAGEGGAGGSGGATAQAGHAGGAAGHAGTAAGSGGAGAGGAGAGGAGGAGGTAAGSGGNASEPKRCGTRGAELCADGEFCDFAPDSDCGGSDRGGTCESKPDICMDIEAPVCGCDNRTWPNDCYAHRQGVSVQRDGLCGPDECSAAGGHTVTSDGASTPECAQGEQSWSISGGREQTLCCVPAPTTGKTCGGIANLQCDSGQFCNYETTAGGQGCDGTVADAGGTCEDTPQSCTKEYMPVCGCDHKTYGNNCESHAAGAAVLHDGACVAKDCDAVGGHVVFGTGPGPMCAADEDAYTSITGDNGQIPIEGALCCVPR